MGRNHVALDQRRWSWVRRQVLDEARWRCAQCARYANEVDHVRALHKHPEQDPYDVAGLQALCKICHIAKTRAENKRPPAPDELAWGVKMADMMRK